MSCKTDLNVMLKCFFFLRKILDHTNKVYLCETKHSEIMESTLTLTYRSNKLLDSKLIHPVSTDLCGNLK